MTPSEAFAFVATSRPSIVCVAGKTSTGKSTFARRLHEECAYHVIDLDSIVDEAVIQPFQLTNRGEVFIAVYKERTQRAWLEAFVTAAQAALVVCQELGQAAVIDGAIANPRTLREILSVAPDTVMLYFHPQHLATYRQYLTSRFQQTTSDYQAGLPQTFWRLVNTAEFRQFCQDGIVRPGLAAAIADYAAASQASSNKRLKELGRYFPQVQVVRI